MRKKLFSVFLAGLIGNVISVAQALAAPRPRPQTDLSAQVKDGVSRLGTGPDARVTVRLRNKAKLSGYVSQADEKQFVVADPKSGTTTPVSYSDVVKVKGRNAATGAKVSVGGSKTSSDLAAAAVGGLGGVAIAHSHGTQRRVVIIFLAAFLTLVIIIAATNG